jgi:uroporphyrinogen-III synthase
VSTAQPQPAQRRVVITRGAEDCAEWATTLEARGGQPVLLPCISSEALDTPELRAALAPALEDADWLVFTSRRGVDSFSALCAAHKNAAGHRLPALAVPHRCLVGTVGAATAAAARERLGRGDFTGAGTAAELGAGLAADARFGMAPNVLLALAVNAGDTLERTLTAAGARCTRLDVYRTIAAAEVEPKRRWSALGADSVLLASPSAVTGFVRQVAIDAPLAVYTIGPSTTAAARAAGLAVTAQAREPSLEGLLEAMQWRN